MSFTSFTENVSAAEIAPAMLSLLGMVSSRLAQNPSFDAASLCVEPLEVDPYWLNNITFHTEVNGI